MQVLGGHHDIVQYQQPAVDVEALRDAMTRTDPDFARVREAHHDALQVLTAKGLRDGLALRLEREFWERNAP